VVADAEKSAPAEVDWNKQPLGEMSDLELSRAIGAPQARVRLARVARGIPPFVMPEDLSGHGLDVEQLRLRESRWYGHELTEEPCRYCAEARNSKAQRGKGKRMVRWTDQGPACAEHYAALPSCRECPSPAANSGELCDECLTALIRAEREAGGWRVFAPSPVSTVAKGDVEVIRRGLKAFESRQEQGKAGPN